MVSFKAVKHIKLSALPLAYISPPVELLPPMKIPLSFATLILVPGAIVNLILAPDFAIVKSPKTA